MARLKAEPHPAMRAVLERLAAQRTGLPNRYGLPFVEARAQLLREREAWLVDGPACPYEASALRSDRRTVALRVYRPASATAARVLVYLHGGGWCVGSSATHDNIVRRLAVGLTCEAWSVDYALAPEAPFPAGLLDCVAVIRTAAQTHPGARLVIAGDSAGANLALDAALRLRDEPARHGSRNSIVDALLLFYGVYTDALDDASMAAFGDGRWGLSREAHRRYLEAYRGDTNGGDDEPGPSFALNEGIDLAGLPRTRLTVAELDILHDQSHALAAKLQRSGVPVAVDEVPGVIHGFLAYGLALPQARTALDAACAWVLAGEQDR